MPASVPRPPFPLAHRVGSLADEADPWGTFERNGRSARSAIQAGLGDDWDWAGKCVLDFGAGVGRTLRHFVAEMAVAEFHACDIDPESVEWLQANLPGVQSFVNDEAPPVPRDDATFDLVYCISVFTHLLDSWAEWLLEMRRILRPGGLLVASYMGEREAESLAGIRWEPDRMGMFGFAAGQTWDLGGPMVMHAPWWIEEHWGRAFEVVRIFGAGEAEPGLAHGLAVLRRPDTDPPSVADLERPGRDEREARSLAHNLRFVHEEAARLRAANFAPEISALQDEVRSLASRVGSIEGERDAALTAASDLERERHWLVERLHELEAQRDEAAARVREVEADRDRAAARVSEIEADRDSAAARVRALEEDRDAAAGLLAQLESTRAMRLARLWWRVSGRRPFRGRSL